MEWKLGEDASELDNCLSLNFGYIHMKSYISQIAITLESRTKLNFYFPSRCLIVMIGGKYIDRVGDVMEKVNSVTNDFVDIRPLAVFLIGDNYKEDIIIDLNYRFERYKSTPVMVKYSKR